MRNSSRKRYGNVSEAPRLRFSSRKQFFQANSKEREVPKGLNLFFFTSSPIYSKIGEKLAAQLAQASQVTSSRSNSASGGIFWRAQVGLVAIYTPLFTKCTPFLFFCNSFSVTLRNITNFVTILIFLPQGYEYLRIMYLLLFYLLKKSRKLTDCAKTPLFDFRHITEFHRTRKPASFRFLRRLGTSFIACHQVIIPGRN